MIRLIKRYESRKLYDTEESRYVSLDEIATWVRTGPGGAGGGQRHQQRRHLPDPDPDHPRRGAQGDFVPAERAAARPGAHRRARGQHRHGAGAARRRPADRPPGTGAQGARGDVEPALAPGGARVSLAELERRTIARWRPNRTTAAPRSASPRCGSKPKERSSNEPNAGATGAGSSARASTGCSPPGATSGWPASARWPRSARGACEMFDRLVERGKPLEEKQKKMVAAVTERAGKTVARSGPAGAGHGGVREPGPAQAAERDDARGRQDPLRPASARCPRRSTRSCARAVQAGHECEAIEIVSPAGEAAAVVNP